MSDTRKVTATGLDALTLITRLLQRARLADPHGGIWEAADHQWWWRSPRFSDDVEKIFWIDSEGPVGAVLVTRWSEESWQIDPVVVPGTDSGLALDVWSGALTIANSLTSPTITIPIRDDDHLRISMAVDAGFVADDSDMTKWMDVKAKPGIIEPQPGLLITNRIQKAGSPHHMMRRNSSVIAERLEQCSLYDPAFDLVMETTQGEVAGYSLYWFDPVTRVGLVEPVRTEEPFQRQGVARSLLTHGFHLLAERGATRIKVSCSTDAASRLYESVGFRTESTTTWYTRSRDSNL